FKLEWKTAVIRRGECKPVARMGLDSYLTSKCVALILRNGKRLIRAQQFIHSIAQKQTAGNRQSSFTNHVGIAHQSADRTKPADIDLAFKPMNSRFTERG